MPTKERKRPKLFAVRIIAGGDVGTHATLLGAARAAARGARGRAVPPEVYRREFDGAPWREIPEAEWRGALAAKEGAL